VAGSVLKYRVDLELTLVTVVGQLGGLLGPSELAGQLGQHEGLEQRPERRAGAKQGPGIGGNLVCGDARVDEDELRSGRGSGAEIARPSRDPFDEKDFLEGLEVTRDRRAAQSERGFEGVGSDSGRGPAGEQTYELAQFAFVLDVGQLPDVAVDERLDVCVEKPLSAPGVVAGRGLGKTALGFRFAAMRCSICGVRMFGLRRTASPGDQVAQLAAPTQPTQDIADLLHAAALHNDESRGSAVKT
jgi:hypothetical protein